MYPVELRLDFFSLLILLGIFQGFFLTYFFLAKENRKILSNRMYGLFILSLSLVMLELWLNYTGYMPRIIAFTDFSEPLSFFIPPIVFLYIRTSIKSNFSKKDYLHFLFFALYVCYSFFYFLQSDEFKFNSFIIQNHPNWELIEYSLKFDYDPIGVRSIVNELTLSFFVIYTFLSTRLIYRETRGQQLNFWKLSNFQLQWLRNLCFHFIAIILIFVFVKIFFLKDLGDHLIASYLTLIIYLASIQVVRESPFFRKIDPTSKTSKYTKSSLTEDQKDEILAQLKKVMHDDQYYLNNMASLPDLSKKISCVPHHVSQVINEKLGKSFFEWLAENRIEKAKEILANPENHNITIEDLAERVGYNSKSSFNKAFKKHTALTPSQFRDTL